MEITLQLRFVLAYPCEVVSITSQYILYLFDMVTFFYDDRITLYSGTFELRMEVALQLRFVFARHCDVFSITSQLRYLLVRCSYVF